MLQSIVSRSSDAVRESCLGSPPRIVSATFAVIAVRGCISDQDCTPTNNERGHSPNSACASLVLTCLFVFSVLSVCFARLHFRIRTSQCYRMCCFVVSFVSLFCFVCSSFVCQTDRNRPDCCPQIMEKQSDLFV